MEDVTTPTKDPCPHLRIKLVTKYHPNLYETTQRGFCEDCGASLDVTDFPENTIVRDESGRLVD